VRGKKEAKKIDKNAPKRSITPYFFYMKARRESLKMEHPSMDNIETIRKMGEEWGKMNETERAPYVKKYEGDKIRYEKEKIEYDIKKGTKNVTDKREEIEEVTKY